MSRAARLPAPAALAALIAIAASAALAQAPAPGTALSRPVDVAAPGWVRVVLDGPAHAIGVPGGFAVLDPEGRTVPFALVPERTGAVAARLVSAGESPGGWSLVFDLGVGPLLHDELTMELSGPGIASGLVLEGSDDLARWSAIGRGELFQVGPAAGLRKDTLQYDRNGHRYLRVTWPRAAGTPRLERAEVRALRYEPRPRGLELSLAPLDGTPGAWVAGAPTGPRPEVERLELAGRGPGEALVYAAAGGRWRPAGRIELIAGPEHPPQGLALDPRPTALFRVDVPAAERLERAEARPPLAWLVFRAATAGRYRLVPAGAAPATADPGAGAPSEVSEPATAALLGPEEPFQPPPLDEQVRRPVPAQMPRHWWSWVVNAPAAVPGRVVRVDLPDALFDRPSVRAEYLRPMSGSAVLPFTWVAEDLPIATGPETALTLERRPDGTFAAELPLPAHPATLSQLEFAAADATAAEGLAVTIGFRALVRPGGPPEVVREATHAFRCEPAGLPCRLLADVAPPDGVQGAVLVVRMPANVFGGAPQASPALTARWWRARHAILFAWPEGGQEVRLVSGFDPVRADAPQVVRVKASLFARQAVPATLDLTRTAEESQGLEAQTRWALVAAIAIAAFVLGAVLLRALRAKPA